MSQIVGKARLLASRTANLETVARAILAMGLLGSAITIIVGFIPTCPLILGECYSDEKVVQWGLVASGATAAFAFWWLFAFSNVIAGQAALAAEIALPTATASSNAGDAAHDDPSVVTEAPNYESFRKEAQ